MGTFCCGYFLSGEIEFFRIETKEDTMNYLSYSIGHLFYGEI